MGKILGLPGAPSAARSRDITDAGARVTPRDCGVIVA